MNETTGSTIYGRGIIAPIGLQNSSWNNSETYLKYIFDIKSDFGPFNYVYLDMSAKTGLYSMYYMNNINSKFIQKLVIRVGLINKLRRLSLFFCIFLF